MPPRKETVAGAAMLSTCPTVAALLVLLMMKKSSHGELLMEPVNINHNTFYGKDAGINTKSSNNTFLGITAGRENTTGNNNTFLGIAAGRENTTGNNNTFVGRSAGAANTHGDNNTFIYRVSNYLQSMYYMLHTYEIHIHIVLGSSHLVLM